MAASGLYIWRFSCRGSDFTMKPRLEHGIGLNLTPDEYGIVTRNMK